MAAVSLVAACSIATGCASVPAATPRAAAAADAADLDVARHLFSAGLRASRQERWEEAYDSFSRAAELHRGALVIYSLAVAEMKTGRLVVALEHLRAFVVMRAEPETARFIPAAKLAIGDLERRVARVRLAVGADAPSDLAVELDGTLVSRASLGEYRLIDPGKHIVRGSADDHATVEREFVAAEGSTTDLTLRLDPHPAAVVSGSEDDSAVVPIALMGTGGGVFLVGAGVGIAGIAESSQVRSMDSPAGESARAKTIAGEAVGAAGVITAGVGVVLYVLQGNRAPSGIAMRFD